MCRVQLVDVECFMKHISPHNEWNANEKCDRCTTMAVNVDMDKCTGVTSFRVHRTTLFACCYNDFFAFSPAIPCMARWHIGLGCVRVCKRDGTYLCLPVKQMFICSISFYGMCLVHLCMCNVYVRILCRCCVPTKQQNACICGSSIDRPVEIAI